MRWRLAGHGGIRRHAHLVERCVGKWRDGDLGRHADRAPWSDGGGSGAVLRRRPRAWLGTVESGGTVQSGATLYVSSGVTVSGMTVAAGGALVVLPGGSAWGTIDSGSVTVCWAARPERHDRDRRYERVATGGTMLDETVSSGWVLSFAPGGVESGGTVASGASVYLPEGFSGLGITVQSGGLLEVLPAGVPRAPSMTATSRLSLAGWTRTTRSSRVEPRRSAAVRHCSARSWPRAAR